MTDPYEILVRWYLRFNGYFCVENFVIHEPSGCRIPQGGETDVLAVRFPHSREEPGFEIDNDPRLLDDEAVADFLVDFVIAEVKGGQRPDLNKVWGPSDPDGTKARRIAYLVRWFGAFGDEGVVRDVASELQMLYRSRRDSYLLRLVYFGWTRSRNVEHLKIRQITFAEIAHFFVSRVGCWMTHGLGVRSAHEQWHPLIKRAWEMADPAAPGNESEKIDRILGLFESGQSTFE